MRIKRFAGVPLLGAVEKNKRTLAPLAKTEPQTVLQRCLFQLNPVSSSSIDSCWEKTAELARQSCQGTVAAFPGCSFTSESRMFLQLRLWNFQVAGISESRQASCRQAVSETASYNPRCSST